MPQTLKHDLPKNVSSARTRSTSDKKLKYNSIDSFEGDTVTGLTGSYSRQNLENIRVESYQKLRASSLGKNYLVLMKNAVFCPIYSFLG